MSFTFEPIESSEHFEHAARLFSAFNPSMPSTAESLIERAKSNPPDFPAHRFLVRDGGDPLMYLRIVPGFWLAEPNIFMLNFEIDPAQGRWDLLPAALEFAENIARSSGAVKFQSWAPSHYPELTRFLESKRFVCEQTNPETMLDLTAFDGSPYESDIETCDRLGVRMISLLQLAEERPESWLRDYYDWEMEVMHDVPLAGGFIEVPFETYAQRMAAKDESPELFFVALVGDIIAASTQLHLNPANQTIGNTGLTGCRREFRRKGLARALKVKCFSAAKEAGVTSIYTDNEENNPMFQLNLALGFREIYKHRAYAKDA